VAIAFQYLLTSPRYVISSNQNQLNGKSRSIFKTDTGCAVSCDVTNDKKSIAVWGIVLLTDNDTASREKLNLILI